MFVAREKCSTVMENLGMFVKSLLVLAVVIQTLDACSCEPRTMEEAMCDADTVLMAVVDKEKNKASEEAYSEYEMYLDEVYKNGTNPLSLADDGTFEMMVPRIESECSTVLEIDTTYFLSGVVNTAGILEVNKCELIKPVPWNQLTLEEVKAIRDLLTGKRSPNCGGV